MRTLSSEKINNFIQIMATKNYTTKTASLRVTNADIRNLDVKKINLDGKNILEYIDESVPTIKHANDTRETVTENDLWGQWVETKDDGTVVVHDDWVTNPNASNNSAWDSSITKVEDNKAYTNDTTYKNIQTEKIKNGEYMFSGCDNLTSFTSDLSNLTNGHSMFIGCDNLTSFSSDLSSLMDGAAMFADCTEFTSFSSDLSSLENGNGMFYGCTNLTSFTSDLPNLTDGDSMFIRCWNLTSFASDSSGSPVNLSSLTNAYNMFKTCSKLTTFYADLPSLTNGTFMFQDCENLTSFASDSSGSPVNVSSLTNGDSMFLRCWNLTSFSSDLPKLTNGNDMFKTCSKLTSFTSDLSSLTNGYRMFYECKLTPQSVMYIVESIRNITEEKAKYPNVENGENGEIPWVTYDSETQKYSAPFGFMEDGQYVYTYNSPNPYTTTISSSDVGLLTLGIDVTNDSATIEQQLQTFAEGCLCDSWAELKQEFVDKGWTVTFQYGGTTDEIPNTYDLRNREQIIPCQIFAKLVEADKDSAEYCTEDASTFYNIEWGHDVTDTSSYTQFNSLEDAMTSWNVFPKENIITTEE